MVAPLLRALLLVSLAAVAVAQDPAPSPTVHTGVLGATYAIPSDWEVVDAHPMLPALKQEQSKSAASEAEKKGVECVQLSLTARHGNPASVIVVVELPFDCFGQTMSEKDLPGFAEGASEGLKKNFNISDPSFGAYQLGSHSFWIERTRGTVIDHPEAAYNIEISCTILKRGAACWMAMASDPADLKTFEQGDVSLDGESPTPLVPASAFDKKPGS